MPKNLRNSYASKSSEPTDEEKRKANTKYKKWLKDKDNPNLQLNPIELKAFRVYQNEHQTRSGTARKKPWANLIEEGRQPPNKDEQMSAAAKKVRIQRGSTEELDPFEQWGHSLYHRGRYKASKQKKIEKAAIAAVTSLPQEDVNKNDEDTETDHSEDYGTQDLKQITDPQHPFPKKNDSDTETDASEGHNSNELKKMTEPKYPPGITTDREVADTLLGLKKRKPRIASAVPKRNKKRRKSI